ncbi:MAG: hypothetical protein HY720_18320, partial [Planctomycetes bacterium]|nr:hypothetical protein [Planctomycetota bacterium]
MVPRTIAIVLFALALLVPVLGDELALDDVVALLDMGYGEDEVIVQVQRSGARFDLSPADEERLRRAGASDRLIEALRERPPGAEAVRWLGEVDPNAFETSTRARERFVSSLTIPTDWKEFPGQSAHLFAFEADWIGSGYLGDRKVICQVVLGEATDPARALEAWMRRRIVLAAGESEIETKRSSVAPLPGGGSIASLRLWEKFGFQANFPPLTFLDGYLVRWHGYSLFLGTWWEIDELVVSEEDARETEERLGPEKEAYNAFVQEELLAVAANARFRELPPRNEEWTRRLADLGSFDAEGIHWRFREDGACELWADGHVGVDHRTWYRVRKLHAPTIDDGYPDGREGQLPGRTSYEVRGADGGGLWILVTHPSGWHSF